MNNFLKSIGKKRHNFHIVDPSPWPIAMAFALFILATGAALYFYHCKLGGFLLTLGFFFAVFAISLWFRDVIRESAKEGYHTKQVQQGIIYGMMLFIVSELLFFAAFFWAYFHSSLAPTIEIGGTWPPYLLWNQVINPFGVPLLNTVILLISGATITWAHHCILLKKEGEAVRALILTIYLAILFIITQALEYVSTVISISDGIYGSTFYLLTGFHGFHVIIGTIFIIVCLIRYLNGHFTPNHHVGFTAAAWYWHFVDVVWLFLFIFVYVWGHWEPVFILN
jgi:cytochrome c oxidase subunit 3